MRAKPALQPPASRRLSTNDIIPSFALGAAGRTAAAAASWHDDANQFDVYEPGPPPPMAGKTETARSSSVSS
jgi:hypothetical protein